jgi:hypothetical protein
MALYFYILCQLNWGLRVIWRDHEIQRREVNGNETIHSIFPECSMWKRFTKLSARNAVWSRKADWSLLGMELVQLRG